METFVTRLAVFERSLSVFGYELFCGIPGGDAAQAVEASLNTLGLSVLTSGKPLLIGVSARLLVDGQAALLPAERTLLVLPKGMLQGAEVLGACRKLKQAGFKLLLDDFDPSRASEPLVADVDFLRVDYRTIGAAKAELPGRWVTPRRRLAAKHLESHGEVREASTLGYALLQGQFFCRPETLGRKELTPQKLNFLALLREVNRPQIDPAGIEQAMKRDLGLSMKLLKYVNSALFSLKAKVESIRQAAMLLGPAALKQWVSLLATASLGEGKPSELVLLSLARARFCELIAEAAGLRARANEFFMMGLLAAADALLDLPMAEILKDLPLTDAVGAALGGDRSDVAGKILGSLLAYEKGDWQHLAVHMEKLPVDILKLPAVYRASIKWASEVAALA